MYVYSNATIKQGEEAARLLIPIARALDYAHKRNLIHRDIKPSNILITESGEPMLTDFGVAKIIDEEATLDLTGTSAAVGTPEYMAPEQATSKNVDHRADIYALGIVFYEMVTGRRPFQADTPLAVLFKQASEPLPRPKSFVPSLPDAVEKILLKALAKRPDDRYQGMGEVVHAMESLLSGVAPAEKQQPAPSKPQVARPRERTLDTQATIDQNEESTIQDRPAPRTRSTQTVPPSASSSLLRYWPLALIGILLVGALSIGLYAALFPRLRATPAPEMTAPVFTPPVITEAPVATEAPTEAPTATEAPTQAPTAVQDEITDDQGVPMRLIPAGEFTMGSDADDALVECQKYHISCSRDYFTDEEPPHQVYLDSYYIDKYEVTNALYEACVNAGVCDPPQQTSSYTHTSYYGESQYADYPVIYVDWNQATTYCEWRGARLPTEAEWEKAARGTDGRTYPWGNESPNSNLLNYNQNVGDTTEVGKYPAGASMYGALDMAGNVWEWVADWYDSAYYSNSPSSNPLGPSSGDARVLRGGSWYNNEDGVRSASRYRFDPSLIEVGVGFRCALSLP